jgi:hypothetical protein
MEHNKFDVALRGATPSQALAGGKPATAPVTKPRPDVTTFLRILFAILAIVAVVKELRLPEEERTWHGVLGGFVPYDLRTPTFEKTKNTLWNPDGAIVTSRVFGVGWSINLGAIVAKLRSLWSTD